MKRIFLAGLALTVLLAAGCLGYRVGPVRSGDYRSVAVPMFRNETTQPQLEAQVTNAILRRLQADGSLAVESADNADVVVRGTIVGYRRSVLRSRREDTHVPREYRLSITARIEARDQRSGRPVIAERDLTGSAPAFVGSDLQSAELQALPLIADDLARQVVALLTEGW